MNIYLSDAAYADLLTDLAEAFAKAANSTDHTLPEFLTMALANADILPETCRADFENEAARAA